MLIVWIVTLAAAGALAAVLAWMYARAGRAANREDLDDPVPFSPERYPSMGIMLSREDEDVLAALPGYRPEIGERFRRDRRRIARMYLRDLRRDFRRLHSEARGMVAHSGEDSAALIGMLMRRQLAFWRASAMLEVRVALHALGAGPVDLRAVVESVERMRMDLRSFEPAQSI